MLDQYQGDQRSKTPTSETCHFLLEARTLPFGVPLLFRVPPAVSFLSASCAEETANCYASDPFSQLCYICVIIVLQSLKGRNWGEGRIKEVGEVMYWVRQVGDVACALSSPWQ